MGKYLRHLQVEKVRVDGITVESHALWNFGRRPRLGYANQEVEDLHAWRAHYPVNREGVHAPQSPSRVGFWGLIQLRAKHRPEYDHRMAVPNEHSTEEEFAGTLADARCRRYPIWISADGNFDHRHLGWSCSDRDWQDIKDHVRNLARKPLDIIKRWYRP